MAVEEPNPEIEDFIEEVITIGLVWIEKPFYKLTKPGILLTTYGKTYDDFLEENKAKPAANIHVGHTITGSHNITDSHLYRSLNSPSQNPDIKANTTPTRVKIISWVKIISLILAAIISAIAIYSIIFN